MNLCPLGFLWLLAGPVWAQSPPEITVQADAAGAADPWGALSLADRLAASDPRHDEAVAVLMGALGEPQTEAEARVRLRTLLLRTPPRAAWAKAYEAVLEPDDSALHLQADRAALRDRSRRAAALARLQGRLSRDRYDLEARRAVMEGLLLSGQPNNAMVVFLQGKNDPSLVDLQVVALLARGRMDEAEELAPGQVPGECAPGPVRCAPWLAGEGWGTAASQGLRDMLLDRGPWSRTRADRAQLAVALAEVERIRGRKSAEVAAWKQAMELAPRETRLRESYIAVLLETGQIGTARSALHAEDDHLDRSIKAVQRVSKLDPADPSEATTQAFQGALSLDHDQPIVLRAWAHHRIVTGHPESALDALFPLQSDIPDSSLTDLYSWAAGAAGQPIQGMEILVAELRTTRDPRRWQELVDKLAALLPMVAETAKSAAEPRRALAFYGLARALAPDSTSTLLGLGGTYWALGDLESTRRAFLAARTQGPGNRQALFSLVAVLKAMEREEEAMQVLMDSGYSDYHAQLLELEIQIALESRSARDALRGDRLDEAVELYLGLLRRYPQNPSLMHGLADAYITSRLYEEAADAYALAQRVQPHNPWLRLGEANALVALGEPDLASGVLERMGEPDDKRIIEAMFQTSLAVARMEADLLARDGRSVEAFEKYRILMEVDPGPETIGGLARLYMRHWQYPVAQAFFEEAIDLDPQNSELEMGVVRVLMARERLSDAQHRATSLVSADPSPAHIQLASEVERRLLIQQAIDVAVMGRLDESDRILTELLLTWPDDPDGLTALSDLRLRQDRLEEAWQHALTVLETSPTHSGALGAAQRAGLKLSRVMEDSGSPLRELLTSYQAAYELEPADWIRIEIRAMELAIALNKAWVLEGAGEHERALEAMREAESHFGIEHGRPWVMIGGTWMEMDEPERALQAFELAHQLDLGDPGAIRGMSGAWWVQGRFGPAEDVLAAHWEEYRDLAIGAELARVQIDRGHRVEAQETLSELMRVHAAGPDRPVPRPPEPLPVLSLPSGRSPLPAPDEPRPAPVGPPRFPEVDLGAVRAHVYNPYRVTTYAGAGIATRPGEAGLQQLRLITTPLAMEVVLRGPYRFNMEFVGVTLDNGVDQVLGFSPSVALATSERGVFHTELRAGLQATATSFPRLTWSGLLRGRFDPGFGVELETVRAPVSGSLAAWAGDPEGEFGRVQDTWVGGRISRTTLANRSVGLLGRAGYSDADALSAVPWSQAMGWLHLPILQGPTHVLVPQVGLGAEGMLMRHDRQVGGFEPEQAGMFSPEVYRSASGRLLGRWTTPLEQFGLCTVLGVGPQQVIGEPTLYLGPGLYLGYQAEVELRLEMVEGWVFAGTFKHQGTRDEWHQNIGALQIQRGKADSGMASPSPAFASAVHGPPIIGAEACGPGWSEWGQ